MPVPPPMRAFDPTSHATRAVAERAARAGIALFSCDQGAAIPLNALAADADMIAAVAPAAGLDHPDDWTDASGTHLMTALDAQGSACLVAAVPVADGWSPTALRSAVGLLGEWRRDAVRLVDAEHTTEGFTDQLTDAFESVHLMYAVGRAMGDPRDPERVLSSGCRGLCDARRFAWAAVCVFNRPDDDLALRGRVVASGEPPIDDLEIALMAGELLRGVGGPNAGPVVGRFSQLAASGNDEVIAQPLGWDDRIVGAFLAGGRRGHDPAVSSYDTQLLEGVGRSLSAYLHACTMYRAQERMFLGTVRALTAAIDAKDRYTRGHSDRVAYLASRLAVATGQSERLAQRIHLAGLLHDVGKIGVPEAVLCKQGRLSDAEFELIKQHPTIGHNILKGITALEDVLPGILHHHERFDGRGYPDKLSGWGIPLCARLLAVADTFDAMSSNRSYRAAMPRQKVLDEIIRSAGSQLDPALAHAMVKLDLTEYDRMVTHDRDSRAAAA